jgi:hypothetical protein
MLKQMESNSWEKIYTNENLRLKCILICSFSNSAEQSYVGGRLFRKSVQGFFVKPNSYEKLLHQYHREVGRNVSHRII